MAHIRFGIVVVAALFLLSGCITFESQAHRVHPRSSASVKTLQSAYHNYLIAYMDKMPDIENGFFPAALYTHPVDRWDELLKKWGQYRTDVYVNSFDGSEPVAVSAALERGKHAYFLFPAWSPDGTQVAFAGFVGIQAIEEASEENSSGLGKGDCLVNYTFRVYVLDRNTMEVKEVYSRPAQYAIRLGQKDASSGFVLNQSDVYPVWSKDGFRLKIGEQVISVPGFSSQTEQVAVADQEPDEGFTMTGNALARMFRSPDGQYAIEEEERESKWPLSVPVLLDEGYLDYHWRLKPVYTGQYCAVYLRTPRGRELIATGKRLEHAQWTPDNEYCVVFSSGMRQFYIVTRSGALVTMNGAYPAVYSRPPCAEKQ